MIVWEGFGEVKKLATVFFFLGARWLKVIESCQIMTQSEMKIIWYKIPYDNHSVGTAANYTNSHTMILFYSQRLYFWFIFIISSKPVTPSIVTYSSHIVDICAMKILWRDSKPNPTFQFHKSTAVFLMSAPNNSCSLRCVLCSRYSNICNDSGYK